MGSRQPQSLVRGGPLGNETLWRVNAKGGGAPVPLPNVPDQIEGISIPRHSWSIAYTRHVSDTNLWQSGIEGDRPPRQIGASTYDEEEGHFSPDGRLLLFGSGRSGKAQIWVANADGTNARQLTDFESVDVVAGIWRPNSREAIVSVRSKELGERVYRIPVDGPFSMTPMIQGAMATSMSRDGLWLYIVKGSGPSRSIWRTPYPGAATIEKTIEGGASVLNRLTVDRSTFQNGMNTKESGPSHYLTEPLPSS